jgi:hypothetical protein
MDTMDEMIEPLHKPQPGSPTKIEQLRRQIADLHSRWPAHSIPPFMLQLLDDLEEQLADELKKMIEWGDHQCSGVGE